METIRIQNGDPERIEALMLDGSGNPLTGLSNVLLAVRRTSDGYWLDFNDNTFKNTGWTTRQLAMTEVDAANDAGKYKYDFDTTGFSDDTYEIRVDCTGADNVPQVGELKVGGYVDNLDAAISSRSSHSAADVWTVTTRTLTGFGTLIADIWNYATRELTGFGTLAADIWGYATRTLSSFGTLVPDIWNNATRTLTAGTKDTEIDAIKAKTDNLPADPASETALTAINGIVTDTRRIVKNKLTIDTANSKLQLWNDAGTAVLYEWDLTDSDGSTVVLQSGPPANRGVPVTP
jgi:hypothetical protein